MAQLFRRGDAVAVKDCIVRHVVLDEAFRILGNPSDVYLLVENCETRKRYALPLRRVVKYRYGDS